MARSKVRYRAEDRVPSRQLVRVDRPRAPKKCVLTGDPAMVEKITELLQPDDDDEMVLAPHIVLGNLDDIKPPPELELFQRNARGSLINRHLINDLLGLLDQADVLIACLDGSAPLETIANIGYGLRSSCQIYVVSSEKVELMHCLARKVKLVGTPEELLEQLDRTISFAIDPSAMSGQADAD